MNISKVEVTIIVYLTYLETQKHFNPFHEDFHNGSIFQKPPWQEVAKALSDVGVDIAARSACRNGPSLNGAPQRSESLSFRSS